MRGRRPDGRAWLSGTLIAVLTLCAAAASGQASGGPATAFTQAFGDRFFKAYWQLHTDAAVSAGYYAVADKLIVPDGRSRDELRKFLGAALARLHALEPTQMDPATRTDWTMLDNQLREELWSLQEYRSWQWDPSSYNVAEPIALILNTEYAPLNIRLRAVLKRLKNVPAYYAAAQTNIDRPTLEHTRLALQQNDGVAEVLGGDLERLLSNSSLRAAERAEFTMRVAAARGAVQAYGAWLRAQEAQLATGGARSFRLGGELYEKKFAFDIASGDSAAALYAQALAEKERLLVRMDILATQLWPKYFPNTAPPLDRQAKIGGVIDRLSAEHVTADDFMPAIEREIPLLGQWVADHDLVRLDSSKPLNVRVTPRYKDGIAGASIDAPGPYDRNSRTYFNVTPLDGWTAARAESYLREYNRWMLPILVIHEAIPGHYVQLVHANESPSLIKSVFGNGAMIEGWAVYGERVMLESGFGGDTAEQWLIYYKWNLRSVCNTILDYGVHVRGMSEIEATTLLTRDAFQSAEEAAGKWRRVTLSSVQLTQYFAGYSAIYALRERLQRSLGPKFNLKNFHDQFLSYGSAPVGIIRELMEGIAAPAAQISRTIPPTALNPRMSFSNHF